eukprot:g41556.t1
MTSYRKVGVMLAYRPEVFCKAVTQYVFDYSNVEQATFGVANAVVQIGGENNPLNVEAGGMKSENKEDLIMLLPANSVATLLLKTAPEPIEVAFLTTELSLEEVTKKIDECRSVDIVYMDISKAFSKVPQSRLVSKVRSHGIQGALANRVQNWLE